MCSNIGRFPTFSNSKFQKRFSSILVDFWISLNKIMPSVGRLLYLPLACPWKESKWKTAIKQRCCWIWRYFTTETYFQKNWRQYTTIDWEKRPCSRWSIVPHLWLSFFFVRRLIWHILIWQIYFTKWYDTYWYDIWHNHFNCQTIICQFLVCLDPETSHKQKPSKHDLCCCHLSLCLSQTNPTNIQSLSLHSFPLKI